MKSNIAIPWVILFFGINQYVECGIGIPSLGEFMTRLRGYHHPRNFRPMPISRRVSSNGDNQFVKKEAVKMKTNDPVTYEQKKEALKRLLSKSLPSKDSENIKPMALSLLQG